MRSLGRQPGKDRRRGLYRSHLPEHPGVIHLNRYAELVRDKAILRDLARRGTEIAEKALAAGAEPKALVEEAEATIFEVRDSHVGTVQLVHGGQAAVEYVEWVDEHPNGIETGLSDLDALTGGLLPGNLVISPGARTWAKRPSGCSSWNGYARRSRA
jgi:replicative DNA helicase